MRQTESVLLHKFSQIADVIPNKRFLKFSD